MFASALAGVRVATAPVVEASALEKAMQFTNPSLDTWSVCAQAPAAVCVVSDAPSIAVLNVTTILVAGATPVAPSAGVIDWTVVCAWARAANIPATTGSSQRMVTFMEMDSLTVCQSYSMIAARIGEPGS